MEIAQKGPPWSRRADGVSSGSSTLWDDDDEEDACLHTANSALLPQVGCSTQCSYSTTISGMKERPSSLRQMPPETRGGQPWTQLL